MPSVLRTIAAASELLVPLGTGADDLTRPPGSGGGDAVGGLAGRCLPSGTLVRAGESLLREPPRTKHAPTPRAPLAATVIGERTARLTSGATVAVAVLQPEPFQHDSAPRVTSKPFSEQLLDVLTATPDQRAQWAADLASANVSINRPTSPDLFAQLADPARVDTVLVTALDPDAHLGVAARVADESSPDVVAGAVYLARLTGAASIVFALEPTVPDRAKREFIRLSAEASRLADTTAQRLSLKAVTYTNNYPLAETSLLLSRLLGRKLAPGRLPTGRGVLLVDTPAAAAVGRVARFDQPLTHVPLGLFDHRARKTYLLRVPVGTPVAHLLTALELVPGTAGTGLELRTGDVLQDRFAPLSAVISASDLYLHLLAPPPPTPPDPCIRCGWCVEACPTRVHPAAVLEAAQFARADLADAAGVSACVECGLCQFVCPSRLPLLTALRSFTSSRKGGAPA